MGFRGAGLVGLLYHFGPEAERGQITAASTRTSPAGVRWGCVQNRLLRPSPKKGFPRFSSETLEAPRGASKVSSAPKPWKRLEGGPTLSLATFLVGSA